MRDATLIVCILDRSGSMQDILDDAIGGFNSFLEQQKALPGEAEITVALFDDQYELSYKGVPLHSMPALTKQTFVPRGMTALYDAVGRTIAMIGSWLNACPEEKRPNKVIVLILTDGEENSSREYSANRVQEMIKTQREVYSWEFVFVGATEKSMTNAKSIGIDSSKSIRFTSDNAGTRAAYSAMSNVTRSYRGS